MENDLLTEQPSTHNNRKVRIKSKAEHKNPNEKKLKSIDKLFTRIFLSSLLLFGLVLAQRFNLRGMNQIMNRNINFMKIGHIFSGSLGFVLPNDSDITVFSKNSYDYVKYDEEKKINKVYLFATDGIKPLTSGIVTKINKSKDGKFNVYITDSQGITYGYLNMINFDYHIYSFVTPEMIIGLAQYDENENFFTFDLTIEEKGEYYNFYEKTSD